MAQFTRQDKDRNRFPKSKFIAPLTGGPTSLATLTQTLDSATLNARAAVQDDLRLTLTLDDASLNAYAAVGNDARLSVTLDNADLNASADDLDNLRLTATLDDATVVSNATVTDESRNASLAITLDDATLAARAQALDNLRLAVTLDDVTLDADATTAEDFRAINVLDDATINARASVAVELELRAVPSSEGDDFNRADEAIEDSANWKVPVVNIDGILGNVVSNELVSDTAVGPPSPRINAAWYADSPLNCSTKITVASVGYTTAFQIRQYLRVKSDGSEYVLVEYNSGNVKAYSYSATNGAEDINFDPHSFSAGDTIEAQFSGSRLTVLVNDVALLCTSNSHGSSGDYFTDIDSGYYPLDAGGTEFYHSVFVDPPWTFDNFEVGAIGGFQLDDATLHAHAEVGNEARLALTLDDVGIVARATGQAVREATLAVTLDDATAHSSATVADTPVVQAPTAGGTGGRVRRSRRAGRSTAPSYVAPRLSPLPTVEPVFPRISARVSITLDDAVADSRASPLTAMHGGVALAGARLVSRARVLPFPLRLDDARVRATATVDWSDVIADDDELLEILAA